MIEKLEPLQGLDHSWLNKINELVDIVNELVLCEQARTCHELIHKNEAPADQYAKQCKELKHTRKALEIAVDALDTVRQYYRGTAVIRPHNIAAYCDNKIDKIKEITALEQKDEK